MILPALLRSIALRLTAIAMLAAPASAQPPRTHLTSGAPQFANGAPSNAASEAPAPMRTSRRQASGDVDTSVPDASVPTPSSAVEPQATQREMLEPTPSVLEQRESEPAGAPSRQAPNQAADELKKQIAGAYKDPFYMNDFRYLNSPHYQGRNRREALKQIPIGSQGNLDIGGQYRLRYHHEHNMRGLGLTGRDDDFLLDRTRFYFDYRMTKRVRLFSEFLDAGSSYENFAPRPIEVNRLDVQNLFADVVLADSSAGTLTVRGGRQELLFGSQRLLSPLDWANTRRTFEGGRLTWKGESNTTDWLLVRPIAVNAREFDSPNQDQALYGIYNTNTSLGIGPVDTYYLGFEDDRTFARVHTVGTLLKGEADDVLWDNEFGYQFGRNSDGSDLSAFSVTLGTGRKLGGSLKPTFWLYYDWASGDDSANGGWNQLFPLGHRYLGFMDLFGRRNIHDFNSLLTFSATERFTVLTWYHYFLLSNENQGPANVTGTSFNPGGSVGSRDLGHELDLLGTYKINPRSDLVLGYSHFFAGEYYETSLNAQGRPLFRGGADFLYTQWHYNF